MKKRMFLKFAPARIGLGLIGCLIFFGLAGDTFAQKRIFARVEPNKDVTDAKDSILFDVNVDPDDNIAPNILITEDGKRGFVGYSGSGIVLAFSMETGEVLSRIKTGGKPTFATLLSDKQSFAIVSVLDNRIFIIDMDASAVKATYTFTGAQFGFGSLLTLSPDGKFGYISSSGTGEVIKFTIADGKESGSRLKGFQAPAQITATSDGNTILVVDALTEELVFVDAANLTRKSTMKAKDKEKAANFTIFNKAVLSPDETTGIIASRDLNGSLGADTVFLFKTATGEILDTGAGGAEPGYTTLTPDGKNWVILTEFSLTVIKTEDFKSRREVSTVRGEPLGSNNIVFTSDSKYAFYASSAADVVYQHDLFTSAVVGQALVGDSPNVYLDQPSSLAMAPDGKTLAVLDYVSNNIELMSDAFLLEGTRFISSDTKFTGLTLINLGSKPTKFTLFALNNFGEILTEEGVENPIEYDLDPNHQISFTVAQIFRFDDTTERLGWLAVVTDQPDVAGYVSYGDTSLTTLDGAPLFRGPLYDWVIPEVVRKEGRKAEIDIVDPYYNQSTYDVARIFKDGTVDETRTNNTAFPTNRHAQVFGEQFTAPEEVTDGYLRYTSTLGVLCTEYFGSDKALGVLNGIDMDKYIGVKTVYSPQFAVGSGVRTVLNLINGSAEDADITITLHGADGKVIGLPFKKTMVINEQIKDDLETIFKDDPDVKNVVGWLEVESTKDRIVGTVTFSDTDENYLSSLTLSGTPLKKFLFPVIAEDSTYSTGIALLNNSDEAASVTLEIWGNGGTLDRSTTFQIAAKNRTAVYLSSYFPTLEPRQTGNIRIRSDKALHGFALIHDKSLNFMTALPPIPLP